MSDGRGMRHRGVSAGGDRMLTSFSSAIFKVLVPSPGAILVLSVVR